MLKKIFKKGAGFVNKYTKNTSNNIKLEKYSNFLDKKFITTGIASLNADTEVFGISFAPKSTNKLIKFIVGVQEGKDSDIVRIFDKSNLDEGQVVLFIKSNASVKYNVLDNDKKIVRVIHDKISSEYNGMIQLTPSSNCAFLQGETYA